MFIKVFGKNSFWSYLIAFLILLAATLSHSKAFEGYNPNTDAFFRTIAIGGLAFSSMLFVDWAVRTLLLHQKSSYHLLVFALFYWMLPVSQWNIWLWIAVLFFWLSQMQVLRFDGKTKVREVAFNAGFWLFFATLFRADFSLFFLLLWFQLYLKGCLDLKNIFLTVLPVLCIALIWMMLYLVIPGFPPLNTESFSSINYSFFWQDQLIDNSGFLVIILTGILIFFKYVRALVHTNNDTKIKGYSMLVILFSSVLIILLFGAGNGASWISLQMGIAVLSTQYFESFSRKWLVDFFFICYLGIIFQSQILFVLN